LSQISWFTDDTKIAIEESAEFSSCFDSLASNSIEYILTLNHDIELFFQSNPSHKNEFPFSFIYKTARNAYLTHKSELPEVNHFFLV
jgi:hypothetical protein